jgi:hypothetical protein
MALLMAVAYRLAKRAGMTKKWNPQRLNDVVEVNPIKPSLTDH